MAKYIINVREVWVQMISIEANSKEEALDLVCQGKGEEIDDTLEFSHLMDKEYWTVDKDES